MKPIQFDEARSSALSALAAIRSDESTRLRVLDLVDSMLAGYQVKAVECPDAELSAVRAAAQQLRKLRQGLTEKELRTVGLFLP